MTNAPGRTYSERLFRRYVESLGLKWSPEPELPTGRRLDFRIEHPRKPVYCEVTEIEVDDLRSFDGEAFRTALRRKIDRKTKQAKGLSKNDLFVIVCFLPSFQGLYDIEIPAAMFGDPGFRLPLVRSPIPIPSWFGGGRLQRKLHTSVAAIGGLRTFNPTQADLDRHVRGEVGESPSLEAAFNATWDALKADQSIFDPGAEAIAVDWYHNQFRTDTELLVEVFRGLWDRHWSMADDRYKPVWKGGNL